jgi:hypothetical protein
MLATALWHLNASGSASVALLRLGRRVADVLVITVGCLIVLRYFGINPTAALAGLGIGGIAVALAAQKTLENVIGGLSLIFDKAVRVGDFLKLGETIGTVDEIGLRSTRIRTLDRSVVTVPNGQIAAATIETLSDRDKFWFHHFVGLNATTSGRCARSWTTFEDLLVRQPGSISSVRVRFLRLGAFSLDIELYACFARDWSAFLEVRRSCYCTSWDRRAGKPRLRFVADAARSRRRVPSWKAVRQFKNCGRCEPRNTEENQALLGQFLGRVTPTWPLGFERRRLQTQPLGRAPFPADPPVRCFERGPDVVHLELLER